MMQVAEWNTAEYQAWWSLVWNEARTWIGLGVTGILTLLVIVVV